jgi:hypothetical protein
MQIRAAQRCGPWRSGHWHAQYKAHSSAGALAVNAEQTERATLHGLGFFWASSVPLLFKSKARHAGH